MVRTRETSCLAAQILHELGGGANIAGATRCATRLRFVLRQTPPAAARALMALPGVITATESGGQFQIVVGMGLVEQLYREVAALLESGETLEDQPAPPQSISTRIVAAMSAVFAPYVYMIAGAGILRGLLTLVCTLWPWAAGSGTVAMFDLLTKAPFQFLPIFVAVTAARYFKCNVYLAVMCCCALVSPGLADLTGRVVSGEALTALGLSLSSTDYTGTVLAPMLMVWLLSHFERFVEKRLPEVCRALFTPVLCLTVMVPLTLLAIGPLIQTAADLLATGYTNLEHIAPPLAGAIVGGFWQCLVIFGVHWGFTPVILANHTLYGYDSFQAYQTVATVAQLGAAAAVWFTVRSRKMKGAAASSCLAAFFGVTEPAIYGITLRLRRPFVCGCIAGGVAGAVMSFFDPVYYTYAPIPGLLTVLNTMAEGNLASVFGELLGCGIALAGAFVLVLAVGYEQPNEEQPQEIIPVHEPVRVYSPLSGTAMPLSALADPVFGSGAVGQGAAILPADGCVFAPFDGLVVSLAPTGHAVGIEGSGVQMLIHVGLESYKGGKGMFTPRVEQGQTVHQGDLLLEFDLEALREAGVDLSTPVVVANSRNFEKIAWTGAARVSAGQLFLTVD